ncbi:MAG: M50 family metallopeptidase [Dehalococcoidales bacterium]|nr:M50 family metallopeptidase [Dehalococcoidales bacterium]
MLDIVAFVLVLGLLVFIHEAGHFVTAKMAGIKVEEFGFGFPPRLFAVRRGETEYSLNLLPLGGFVRMLGEEDPSEARSFASAPKRWRSLVLLAGPLMNMLLAAFLFAGAYMVGWPTATRTAVSIASVVPDSAAQKAGLQPGDIVISMNGQPIDNTTELRQTIQDHLGQQMQVVVERNGAQQTLTVQLDPTWDESKGALGVTSMNEPLQVKPVPYPVWDAVGLGFQRLGDMVAFTVAVPVMVIRGLIPADLARPVGPVGIWQVTSQAATATVDTGWWFPILYVMAALSVGLGIANLLPIPGLDGGRLLFVGIEAIRGRRISPRMEGIINVMGIALLLTLVVVISFYDVSSPLPTLNWGLGG